MTGPDGGKLNARSYSAGATVNASAGPLDWGDKCFLCSQSINIDTPPVDPREFYVGKTGGMYMCHSSCVDTMNRAGGTPRDFHTARAASGEDLTPKPEPVPPKPPVKEQGAGWLAFDCLADYDHYVKTHQIPETTKVTIGGGLVQPGE